ncbi:MAG: acetate--CoA ligase family protein, partial [bacterium]|nr:acetate--CoA ligase family protein [bacterium]
MTVISQSGAFIFGITNTEQGFPLGYGLSVGNEAVVKTSDCVEFALSDPRVKAIGLYLEGVTDGPALSTALGHALERDVPVVVLYGGGGLASARQAVSHTGNLTASNDLWGALIARYGLIRVKSPKELVETLKILSLTGRPHGNRLFVATYSGATGVLLSDQAEDYGLTLPAISDRAAEKVRPRLPPVVPIANPLDLNLSWTGGEGITLDDSEAISDGLLDLAPEDADILAFMLDVPRAGTGIEDPWRPTLEAMIKLKEKSGLPTVVASILHDGLSPEHRRKLAAGGVAPLLGFADSGKAMGLAAKYAEARREILGAGAIPQPLESSGGSRSQPEIQN